jgi:hypothetical protein
VACPICSFPSGTDFRAGPNLTPDQHTYRAANPAWIPPLPPPPRGRGERSELPPQPPQSPATISKFTVRRHLHNGRDYWSPYDLLGLFLSSIGPAPDGATKRNFYLPMTAAYGRWCRQIAGSYPRNGVCDHPYMFQCTIPRYPAPQYQPQAANRIEDYLAQPNHFKPQNEVGTSATFSAASPSLSICIIMSTRSIDVIISQIPP